MDIKKYFPLIIIALLLVGNIVLFIEVSALKARADNEKEDRIEKNFKQVEEAKAKEDVILDGLNEKSKETQVIKTEKRKNYRHGILEKNRIESFNDSDSLYLLITRRYQGP